jgi:cell wall-associated NlpC family hydrolase
MKMKRMTMLIALSAVMFAGRSFAADADLPGRDFWSKLESSIQRHLGRPYVWGATGLKSFDCSGFVWRVLLESGVRLKRTTARKLYFSLPRVDPKNEWDLGNVVFFDDLRHCGLTAGPRSFYHAATSTGTHLSQLDPYWRPKIVGIRKFPRPK